MLLLHAFPDWFCVVVVVFFEGFGGEQPAAQSVHHVVRGFAPPVLRGVGHEDVASLLLCDGFGFPLLGFEEALGELFKQVEEP